MYFYFTYSWPPYADSTIHGPKTFGKKIPGNFKKRNLNLLHSSDIFFPCKKLSCFHLARGLGEGTRAVKKLPSGCRQKP